MMKKTSKIYVAGHRGLVGSAMVRTLEKAGYKNIVLRTRKELDLMDQKKVALFFKKEKPEYVFMAASKVGGIMANKERPGTFMYENLVIQTNMIENARISGVKKLLFLGSSCIYPKLVEQPMKEEYLLTGKPEPTNRAYSLAKISGLVLCQSYNEQYGTNFISVMPTNLYGINDNFDLNSSHVLPALIRKFYEAKKNKKNTVELWGSGKPKREFLFVDDLADACVFLMNNYNDSEIINIGTGKDVSIKELSEMVAKIIEYEGKIVWDSTKPDGMMKKLLDVSKLEKAGWHYKTELQDGLQTTYEWFVNNLVNKK
jgi:GDP-L-fucose synthase